MYMVCNSAYLVAMCKNNNLLNGKDSQQNVAQFITLHLLVSMMVLVLHC